MTRVRSAGLVMLALVGVALSGCSQIAALAPVGGDSLAEVRFGAIDVLLAQNVEMGDAPVCRLVDEGPGVTCAGTTLAGAAISVASSTAADATLAVSVDGTVVFTGALQDVLDEAARG